MFHLIPSESSESGSALAGVMLAVAVVGLGSLYISNDQTKIGQLVAIDSKERENEAAKLALRNGVNRFRSLLSRRDLGGTQGLQPALYPADYFAAVWNLNRNNTIASTGVNLTSGQNVNISMSYSNSSLDLAQATSIMTGTPQQQLQEIPQSIQILRTNRDASRPLVVESLDVKVSMRDAKNITRHETARLLLKAPEPRSMRVEISPQGTNQWNQNFNNIAPGFYDVRVIASGVVLQANVNLNGTDLPPLGVSQGGNPQIQHQARNELAVDQEIGRFTYEFTSPRNCTPAPGDGLYQLKVNLTKADGTIYTQAGLSDGTGLNIQVQSQALGQRYVGLGCYWMENYSGNFCWVPAPAWIGNSSTIADCKLLDSCDGGGGMSAGGCYKWADASDAPRYPWP